VKELDALTPRCGALVMSVLRAFTRALVLAGFTILIAQAGEAQSTAAKRVLLISTGSRLAPGFILVDQQILQALAATPSLRIETSAENIDIVRFPEERTQRIFGEYLAAKYSDSPPDLVILVFVGNLGVTGKILRDLFPATPIVVAGYTEEELRLDQFGPHVSGLAQRVNPKATFELMLRLQPELRRIIVIGGTSDVDHQSLARVKVAAEPLKRRVEIEFWDDRTLADLRTAVTKLPPNTAILFSRMFRDAAGQAVISSDVGRWIGQAADAPVYTMVDTMLGTGAVGGSVASAAAFGTRAGELARRILTGTPPASLPFEVRTDTVPMFDWRALQRWHIRESLLPPGSVVRYKPVSIWQQYRYHVAAAVLVILTQAAFIAVLIVQRRRRRTVEASLHSTRELVELATEAGDLGLWSRDMAAGAVWANSQTRALLGFEPDAELTFGDVLGRIHPDDRAGVIAAVDEAHRQGTPFHAEYRIRRPDGTERWLLARGRSMTGSHGEHTHRMGVMLDITERRRSELALRESEDRFRTVADAAPVMIWTAGTDKLCTFFNKGWLDFTGRTLGQELGIGWTEGVHEDDYHRCLRTYETAFDARQEFSREYRLRRHDGEYRDILDRGVPRSDADGTFLGYIGACLDVTERKRAEQRLNEQRAFLRQVIDANPNFIFAKDREGRFTLANKAVGDAYGVKPDDLIGKTDRDFNVNAHEVEFFRRVDLEVMDTMRERLIPEERITDAQGNTRWLQTVKIPIVGSDGRATQVLGASTDITLRKTTEMEVQKQRAELAHVGRVVLMGQLSASVAHELNQPLTAILSNARAGLRFMAHEPPALDELRPILEDIIEANARAAEIIRGMRALLRKEEAPHFQSLDVRRLIADVVTLVHSDAVMQDVRIDLDLDDTLPRVRGDRIQLQQVVLNIFVNAFDAMRNAPADRRIVEVRARREGSARVRIIMSDRGPGLSVEALDKMFQPFYTTKPEGLGMGLSICRAIIQAHDGSIGAENNPQGGAAFYFTVPAAERASPDASERAK
jgi:PAS domain S-box-containing protein